MSSGRSIDGKSNHAYRVVKERYGVTSYFGPYSTLGAAKGKRTTELRHAKYYGNGEPVEIWIERTPAGEWEKVAL